MQGVYGTTMARYIAVPFVNALPWSGARFGCGEWRGPSGGQEQGGGGGDGEGGGGDD